MMVTKSTQVDGGGLDLVLTDVSDLVGSRIGSPVGTSDHSVIFIGIVQEQPIHHLVCRHEVYLNNSGLGAG